MNDGGPVFPVILSEDNGRGYGDKRDVQYPGMSLRDYLAAQAMQSFIQNLAPNPDKTGYIFPSEWRPVVSAAYCIADAMLAERSRK